MSLSHCRFCAHDNPERARFCNECGSPLHLKPCPRCEAVNEDQAVRCYECGASLSVEPVEIVETVATPADEARATAVGDLGRGDSTQPSLHIPESFGERFALEPDGTSRLLDPPDQRADEKLKMADDDRDSAALFDRERRQKRIAMVAVPVLAFAIGLGALYAYRPKAPSAPVAASTDNAVASQDATPAQQPPTETPSAPPATDAQPAEAGPASEPQPVAQRPPEREPASKSAARESKAATNRVVAREVGATTRAPSAPSKADAIATKRIIEREMGRFAQSPQNRRAN